MPKKLPACKEYLTVREILIKKVFPYLRRFKIVARGCYGCTVTSTLYEMSRNAQSAQRRCGIVFWTTQENDLFRKSGAVHLSFNHSDDSPSPFVVRRVGRMVEDACRKFGLTTRWNGTARRTIEVSL